MNGILECFERLENEMSGMNGMNFHSSGMILNVSEWGERQFHDVINCIRNEFIVFANVVEIVML